MRNGYSKHFKEGVVKYAMSNRDKPLSKVAEDFGVGVSTLEKWIKGTGVRRKKGTVEEISLERRRIQELEWELAKLKESQDVIRRALVYFITHPVR